MSDQIEKSPEVSPVKVEATAPKPVKPAKKAAEKEKPSKAKPAKTAFTGRVEEIAIGDSDALQFMLKDKRGKHHTFSISATGSTASARIQLLTTALGTKFKLHVETVVDKPQQVRSLALHAKK